MNKKATDKTEVLSLDELLEKTLKKFKKNLKVIKLKSKLDRTNKILFILLGISILLLIVIIVFIFIKAS